jgi:hypothetical protein
VTAQIFGSTGNSAGFMSVAASCAAPPNNAGSDANSLRVFANDPNRASATVLITGLTPGPCTFNSVYRNAGSGSSTFSVRNIVVIPS